MQDCQHTYHIAEFNYVTFIDKGEWIFMLASWRRQGQLLVPIVLGEGLGSEMQVCCKSYRKIRLSTSYLQNLSSIFYVKWMYNEF